MTDIAKAEKIMGKKIQNKYGSCFDSAAHQSKSDFFKSSEISNLIICHGIAVANMPGIEGKIVAHAWLEFYINTDKAACDPIWNLVMRQENYRKQLKIKYVVEYKYEEFLKKWKKEGYSGPWDKKIKLITDKADKELKAHRRIKYLINKKKGNIELEL